MTEEKIMRVVSVRNLEYVVRFFRVTNYGIIVKSYSKF
jgi:hypothetical protein